MAKRSGSWRPALRSNSNLAVRATACCWMVAMFRSEYATPMSPQRRRASPSIRRCAKLMVKRQRELGRDGGVVMEGRDIGTAVFPNADLKIFLDADEGVRAERRVLQTGSRSAEETQRRDCGAGCARSARPHAFSIAAGRRARRGAHRHHAQEHRRSGGQVEEILCRKWLGIRNSSDPRLDPKNGFPLAVTMRSHAWVNLDGSGARFGKTS